ncbi:MAG: hypothetical protein SFV18_21705 [Bryobacteraceae bacterium]|nr:hypothetical protein [Bryobacteraceae bacterium]
MRFALLALWLAQSPMPAPKPADPDDPGPPVLKRGGRAPRKDPLPGPDVSKLPKEEAPPPSAGPPAGGASAPADEASASTVRPQADSLIERAREAAYSFNDGLPNFLCDQLTLRYSSESGRKPNWKLRDRAEVELLYVDGREDYRNPRLNGKAVKKEKVEETGQWSTGDFGTTLVDVFSSSTAAKFTRRAGGETIEDVYTVPYDFTVAKPHSHWRILFDGEILPAYDGTLFIDPVSARVMRIEKQARGLPPTYKIDVVEMTVTYGWVTISGQKHLLPVDSENLSCERGSPNCSKNEIQFRNYRKFAAESSISTTDSTVSFEGAAEPPPPTPPKKKKQ